jgi:hypothetical protein
MNWALAGPSSHFELSGVFDLSDLELCKVYRIDIIQVHNISQTLEVFFKYRLKWSLVIAGMWCDGRTVALSKLSPHVLLNISVSRLTSLGSFNKAGILTLDW